jgi:integrase
MSHSTPKRPKLPRKFPLSCHGSGKFQKKIQGQLHYFGRWAVVKDGVKTAVPGGGCAEALAEYKRFVNGGGDQNGSGLLVKDLMNAFWTFKVREKKAGPRMLLDYKETTDLLVKHFGKNRPVAALDKRDFEKLYLAMEERWGPVRLGNVISRIRTIFKYAVDDGLMKAKPAYGALFKRPEVERDEKEDKKKNFTADELRALIAASGKQMKAAILVGINCAYGNTDVGRLTIDALDLDGGWAEFPRPKTKVNRRAKLWPETVAALKEVIGQRTDGLVFLSRSGTPLVKDTAKGRKDLVTIRFASLLDDLEMRREGKGFYRLRHSFRTVADGCRDLVAIDAVMGHTNPTMGGRYTHGIEDDRLVAVADHVHSWLFGNGGAA